MKFNCPICGKAGLPDYRREEVLCPACDTDLKAYRLLHQIDEKQTRPLRKFLWVVPCLLFIVALFFIYYQANRHSKLQQEQNEKISSLNDSIASLRDSISVLREINPPLVEPVTNFEYVVRKGDSFCLISQKIYGTEKYAQAIAEANGMDFSTLLLIGYTLKITPP